MKLLYLFTSISVIVALTSCAASIEQPSNNQTHPAKPVVHSHPATKSVSKKNGHDKKNPLTVSFYTKGQPKMPFEVIGEESISKFNMGGHKRQEAYIRDGMRELAAAMGGDAIIDIKHDSKTITGTVVAFKKDTVDNKV